MTKLLLFAIVLLGISISIYAQPPVISPTPGNNTVCPGEKITYQLQIGGNFSSCGSYSWTVSNGSFSSVSSVTSKTSTSNEVDVYWNDVAGNGTLTVSSTCAEGVMTKSSSYAIKSLKDRNPENLRTGIPNNYCGVNTVSVFVNEMILENTGGATGISQQYADGYEWSLPAGWKSNGVSGTVTSSAPFISITPDNGCVGGSLSVKAYMNCNSGKKYSSLASISLDRPSTSITITPQAGYAGPGCGAVQNVTFTVNHSLTCVDPNIGYTWVFPEGWGAGLTKPFNTSSNSITITPSGGEKDGGDINVTVHLTCTISPPLGATKKLVFNKPLISISQPICDDGTTVSLTNVAPSVNVNWSVSSNMYVFSGQGTSSAVMKAVSVGSLGNGTISALVNCPNTTVDPKTVWVGRPSQPGAITGEIRPSIGGIYNYVSSPPSVGAAYYDWLMPYYGNPVWSWYVSPR